MIAPLPLRLAARPSEIYQAREEQARELQPHADPQSAQVASAIERPSLFSLQDLAFRAADTMPAECDFAIVMPRRPEFAALKGAACVCPDIA